MTLDELNILLTRAELMAFIEEHKSGDAGAFALKYSGNKDLPVRALSEQIYCYQKAKSKLPSLSKKSLLYDKTALEQSSGELTACFKASLMKGVRAIDLTGGLGIDDLFISENFTEFVYCEQNPVLAELFSFNLKQTGKGNITIRYGEAVSFLSTFADGYFDWIYVDPARRDENRRFVRLQDCSPDVIEYQDLLLRKARNILIKVSPAYEFTEARKYFPSLSEFSVVSVDNECKEVLLYLKKEADKDDVKLNAVIIRSEKTEPEIISAVESRMPEKPVAGSPLKYFYEPDSAIIKARLSPVLAKAYHMYYLNRNVDYLSSDLLEPDFPGRKFIVRDVLRYNKKILREYLKSNSISKANISRRDFPDSPETIRAVFNLADGGEDYLFFTKNSSGELMTVVCRKV